MLKQTTLSILAFMLVIFNVNAQSVNLDKFIEETQITNSENSNITIAWWIPLEFWEIALSQEESYSAEQMEALLETLRPYNIFAALDGEIGPLGGIAYTEEEDIKKSLKMIHDGKTHLPMSQSSLDPDVRNLLAAFNPVLKNIMGELGENLNFYVFTDLNDKDERLIDPMKTGEFELNFSGRNNKWRLPIGSLLPLKKCPKDNELMDGSWGYCPWHGDKLEVQK